MLSLIFLSQFVLAAPPVAKLETANVKSSGLKSYVCVEDFVFDGFIDDNAPPPMKGSFNVLASSAAEALKFSLQRYRVTGSSDLTTGELVIEMRQADGPVEFRGGVTCTRKIFKP